MEERARTDTALMIKYFTKKSNDADEAASEAAKLHLMLLQDEVAAVVTDEQLGLMAAQLNICGHTLSGPVFASYQEKFILQVSKWRQANWDRVQAAQTQKDADGIDADGPLAGSEAAESPDDTSSGVLQASSDADTDANGIVSSAAEVVKGAVAGALHMFGIL